MKRFLCALCLCLSLGFGDEFSDFEEFEAEFAQYEVNDPLEGYNKFMTGFNVGFYRYFARPAISVYDFVMPDFAQVGIRNFASNLAMPLRLSSLLLQFKFAEAGAELKRFSVNVVFGFFGLIDAASNAGIAKHPADFGTALAHWGVGGGFHLVLPFLGPSNLRDTLAMPVSWYLSPTGYIEPFYASAGTNAFLIGNEMSLEKDVIDELYFNTPNLYPFLRDAYEQRRAKMSE